MAKKSDSRTFNVSVIGMSGTEKEKGLEGVGKSCLCNRFIHQVADKYHSEHISVLSQSDFGGRVINNDHFLYWGEVTKTDEGNNFTFHVIEQTEFVDDVSFAPFKTGRTDPYQKRCTAVKVQSAEKLMYICKDQLGMETEGMYEQKVMPDGKMSIDGILCCFDVSNVPQRTLEKQMDFCLQLLNNAMKTKKPVVLVTTKNDSLDSEAVKESIEKLVLRKEFKNSIPVVETSAHENVNVETAFILLAHLMDKSKNRAKVIPFAEAMRARKEILDVAKEAFSNLLKSKVTDSKASWNAVKKKLEKESDFQHYVDLFGSDKARTRVRSYIRQLREDLIRRRRAGFLDRLPTVLSKFLPDLQTIGDRRSWNTCRSQMLQDKRVDSYFLKVCEAGDSWITTNFVDEEKDERLPLDLLHTDEAEKCFVDHVKALQAAQRKEEMKREFRSLLERYIDLPGTSLQDNYTKFVGKDCYTELSEDELQYVYDDFQKQLKNRHKQDFQELLWEKPTLFRSLNLNQNLTEHDLNVLYNSLNNDQRFRRFAKLDDDRKVMLLNHVVFLEKPSVDRCVFHVTPDKTDKCTCTECQVTAILRQRTLVPNGSSAPPPELSGPIVRPLNMVLLGNDGLATDLYKEIRGMCIDDEYRVAHRVYTLDYRPIEGDVSEEQNSFITPTFRPHGCICVYNSQESLEYIRVSIMTMLETNLSRDENKALEGMPLVIMLAYEPYTTKELEWLRENGKLVASSLRCEFVDIPHEDLAEKLKFYQEQIEQALACIIPGMQPTLSQRIMEATEPDLRVLLCMMCSDPYPMEITLRPFLNEASFVVTSDPETSSLTPEEENVFMFDASLGYTTQKVEITATSYHGGHLLRQRGEIYHGYILAYCPKRKASYASLKAFSKSLPAGSFMMFLAIPEAAGAGYNMNDHSQGLKDGKELAVTVQARFQQVSQATFLQQGAMQVYDKFLHDVWEHRDEVEPGVGFEEQSPPPAYKDINKRPPAPLPNQYLPNLHTSSNSQSTEDSEPLYDQPQVLQHHSDSERASSPSPPPLPSSSPPPPDTDTYYRNDNVLVKPSMLKEKRNQYAGHLREQYRKSFPAVDSEHFTLRNTMSQSMTEHLDTHVEPRYQFRKSRSMKLAVNDELEEGEDGFPAWAINEPKRQSKSSTFPASANRGSHLIDHGEEEESPYNSSHKAEKPKTKPKPLFFAQYMLGQRPNSADSSRIHAPLAMPERIEISEVYGTVKDAVKMEEGDYALVDDALPQGKIHRIKSTSRKEEKGTDSEESEFSSLERDRNSGDLYRKVNRKPTPHKKKHKSRSQQEGPYITHVYVDPKQGEAGGDHGVEHRTRGRSNSPSEDSAGTGDELQAGDKRRSSGRTARSQGSATNLSDTDLISSQGQVYDDEDSSFQREEGSIHKAGSEDNDLDLNESQTWTQTLFKKRGGKDQAGAKPIDRRSEEKRKQKDIEKKQQKLQKKIRKKDSKAAGQSESGISLNDFSMSPNNPSVPQFIEKCVEFIEDAGMHAEGIYRIPGNKAQVDLLTAKYSEDSNVDISSLDIQVNAVATVLKAFFADLTDPLVPVALYEELIEASGVQDKSSRILALRGVFLKMHPLNFEVLKFLITHLHKVSKHSDDNSMDCKNLSRCWWPTLIRMEFDTFEKMTKYSRIPEEILQTLIEQCGKEILKNNREEMLQCLTIV